MTRRPKGIDWYLEMAVGVAEDSISSLLLHGLPTRSSPLSLATSRQLKSLLPTHRRRLKLVVQRVWQLDGQSWVIARGRGCSKRERS